MGSNLSRLAGSGVVSRLAIGGMLLVIVALGMLAVWAIIVAEGHARDLSRASVQTSGYLRATQALGQIDTLSDILEDGIDPEVLGDLRAAQRVLHDSLGQMQRQSFVEWERLLARDTESAALRLSPAVETFLDTVRAGDEVPQGMAEHDLQEIIGAMQLSFSDIRRDPSQPLREVAAEAAAGNRVIARAAIVLIPLALLSVGLCAWLFTTSRKRAKVERERLEAELRLAHRLEAVGQLAAGIAHEINTPIQFVGDSVRFISDAYEQLRDLREEFRAICAGLAEGREDAPAIFARMQEAEDRADLHYLEERVPAAIERTQDGVGRVTTIVAAMRDVGRPAQVERAPADLNEGLRTTLVMAHNEYKYVADVETEYGRLPPVLCNASELNQAFLNLIVNAAHAIGEASSIGSGERGAIRIRTACEDGAAVITISDSGPGVPDEIRERIFDPFFTTREVGSGTGQGLAIANAIVGRHGGTLTLERARTTTFAIRLPIG